MTATTRKRRVRKAAKLGAVGAGAWLAGRAALSVVRVVIGTALVAAAAAAAVTFVPKPVQRRIAGNVRDAARLTREKVMEQARALSA